MIVRAYSVQALVLLLLWAGRCCIQVELLLHTADSAEADEYTRLVLPD